MEKFLGGLEGWYAVFYDPSKDQVESRSLIGACESDDGEGYQGVITVASPDFVSVSDACRRWDLIFLQYDRVGQEKSDDLEKGRAIAKKKKEFEETRKQKIWEISLKILTSKGGHHFLDDVVKEVTAQCGNSFEAERTLHSLIEEGLVTKNMMLTAKGKRYVKAQGIG